MTGDKTDAAVSTTLPGSGNHGARGERLVSTGATVRGVKLEKLPQLREHWSPSAQRHRSLAGGYSPSEKITQRRVNNFFSSTRR